MSHLKSSVASAAFTIFIASHAAFASGATLDAETTQRTVRYSDLNIENTDGAATLYTRIKIAARQVCEPAMSDWQAAFLRNANRCFQKSVDRAVSDVNAPALTNYHRAKSRSVGMR